MQDSIRDSILFNPSLPSLPMVAMDILDLAARPDVDLRDFERTIERDQAISIRILKTVNSSYYGLGRPCGSIRQAVAYLGINTVKALVLGFSLERAIDGGGQEDLTFDLVSYWRKSFLSATTMHSLATNTGIIDPEEAFISGLIQDVGQIAIWRVFGDRYLQVLDMSDGSHQQLIELEKKNFEIDHSELSCELTKKWHFPDQISEMVHHHHDCMDSITERHPLRRLSRFSMAVVDVLEGSGSNPEKALTELRNSASDWFGIEREELVSLIDDIVQSAKSLAKALNINTGIMPNSDLLIAKANRLLDEIPVENRSILSRDQEHTIDEVTGLPDRHSLLNDLDSCFKESKQSTSHVFGSDVALLLVGVDEVRRINERIGDIAGDSAIAHVAECVRSVVKDQMGVCGVYRFVGAEIAVIARFIDERKIRSLAESIRERIACTPIRIVGRSGESDFLVVKSTIGMSTYRSSSDGSTATSPDQLLGSAMCAVTEGRRSGGDQVMTYSDHEYNDVNSNIA